jgi:hypothetical protein
MAHVRPTDPAAASDAVPLPSARPVPAHEAMAHDFNNVLGSMMGWIHLARRKTSDPAIDALLERALAAGERGQRLTRRMLKG